MQPALIITGTATSSSDAFSSTFVTFAMGKPSVNSLPGITIEVKTLGNTIPAPSPSLHDFVGAVRQQDLTPGVLPSCHNTYTTP